MIDLVLVFIKSLGNLFFAFFDKWERFVLAGLVLWSVLLTGTIYFKDIKIDKLNQDLNNSKASNIICGMNNNNLSSAIKEQNTVIEVQRVDLQNNIKTFEVVKPIIETKYKTIYQTITKENSSEGDKLIKIINMRSKDENITFNK